MAIKRQPFAHVVRKTAASGTNNLQDSRVGSGRRFCYQHVSVINETNPFTRLRLMVSNGGQDHLLEEEQSPLANTLYWTEQEYYLIENDIMTAELTGCTANDVLKMYVRGYKIIEDEEG